MKVIFLLTLLVIAGITSCASDYRSIPTSLKVDFNECPNLNGFYELDGIDDKIRINAFFYVTTSIPAGNAIEDYERLAISNNIRSDLYYGGVTSKNNKFYAQYWNKNSNTLFREFPIPYGGGICRRADTTFRSLGCKNNFENKNLILEKDPNNHSGYWFNDSASIVSKNETLRENMCLLNNDNIHKCRLISTYCKNKVMYFKTEEKTVLPDIIPSTRSHRKLDKLTVNRQGDMVLESHSTEKWTALFFTLDSKETKYTLTVKRIQPSTADKGAVK